MEFDRGRLERREREREKGGGEGEGEENTVAPVYRRASRTAVLRKKKKKEGINDDAASRIRLVDAYAISVSFR